MKMPEQRYKPKPGVPESEHSRLQRMKKMFIRFVREKLEKVLFIGAWPARLGMKTGYQGQVDVTRYRFRLPGFPKDLAPLHIVFASDFHMGPTTHSQHIQKSIEEIARLEPDILLFGGDFVYLKAKFVDDWLKLIEKSLHPSLLKYAVLGNHDNHLDPGYIANALEKAGVKMLTNRCALLPEPYDFVSLHGLDDWQSGMPDVSAAFSQTAAVKIVLMHSPSNYLDLQDIDFDLAFCGHTHGGQIARKDGSPLRAGSGPLSRQYNFGIFRLGEEMEKTLIVSRGVGFGSVPFRINSAPEIVSVRLMPE
ncbi:MAG: metallophosphoesterase [Calditrichaeota bacterium]|nr:MAG: metallophosphoesterase [Calditrichota bacterium]